MSRTIATLAVAFLAAMPAAAQDNEAEKVFRALEKKLKNAKALEIAFTYQLEGKTTKGSLLLTSDNKARLEVSGPFHFGLKNNAKFTLVSDGKQLQVKGAKFVFSTVGRIGVETGGQMELATPKTLHNVLVAGVHRGGVGVTVLGLPVVFGEFDPDDQESKMATRDFKLGAAEKVGERPSKVLHYRYGKGGNDDAELTLWLDAETGLPLKRVLFLPKNENIRIPETYSQFQLNPKIDAKAFGLPK